jgi:hypothetical protein
MNIAICQGVEIQIVHLTDGTLRVEVRLATGARTFDCRSEAIAIAKAKIMIDKDHLGTLDQAPE